MLKDRGYLDKNHIVVNGDVHTFYELRVIETIKGTVSKGDIITVRISGGLYNNTLIIGCCFSGLKISDLFNEIKE